MLQAAPSREPRPVPSLAALEVSPAIQVVVVDDHPNLSQFWDVLSYLLSGMNNQVATTKKMTAKIQLEYIYIYNNLKDMDKFFLEWLLQKT